MEQDSLSESPELGEVIDMIKQLTEQADEKIREATQKIKATESIVSENL